MFDHCFRAVDDTDGSLAILKILPKSMDSENLLAHELRVCSRLSHANIIRYDDILIEPDFTILVAAYFDAAEFQNVACPPADVSLTRDPVGLSVFHQLQEGLDCLHNEGLIHAGLSRASVLIDTSGNVKIINLLHSHDLEIGQRSSATDDHRRLMYGSPEHVSGELTTESDYFAVGTLMFEYLLRRHPFWRVGLRIAFERIRVAGVDRFLLDPNLYNVDRNILKRLFSSNLAERREGWDLLRALESRR